MAGYQGFFVGLSHSSGLGPGRDPAGAVPLPPDSGAGGGVEGCDGRGSAALGADAGDVAGAGAGDGGEVGSVVLGGGDAGVRAGGALAGSSGSWD